jgi:hypothetical protein
MEKGIMERETGMGMGTEMPMAMATGVTNLPTAFSLFSDSLLLQL